MLGNIPDLSLLNSLESLNLSNNDFIRTTEKRHYKSVYEIWDRLIKSGDIYLKPYYDEISLFHEDLAIIGLNDKYGFINKSKKKVIAIKFDGVSDFENNRSNVEINENQIGIKINADFRKTLIIFWKKHEASWHQHRAPNLS